MAEANERVVVKCIDAFRDKERAGKLIIPPARLSVTPERAKELIEKKLCVAVEKK